jgi:hypothetical protein
MNQTALREQLRRTRMVPSAQSPQERAIKSPRPNLHSQHALAQVVDTTTPRPDKRSRCHQRTPQKTPSLPNPTGTVRTTPPQLANHPQLYRQSEHISRAKPSAKLAPSHPCNPCQFVIFRHPQVVLVSFLPSFGLVPSPNLRISPVLLRLKADRISPLFA